MKHESHLVELEAKYDLLVAKYNILERVVMDGLPSFVWISRSEMTAKHKLHPITLDEADKRGMIKGLFVLGQHRYPASHINQDKIAELKKLQEELAPTIWPQGFGNV